MQSENLIRNSESIHLICLEHFTKLHFIGVCKAKICTLSEFHLTLRYYSIRYGRISPWHRDIFYYRPTARSREVDFVVTDRGNVIELIQVALDISHPKTLSRELNALVEASHKTGCQKLTLIACAESRTEKVGAVSIAVVSTIEWLLS